jgi:uncharacterized protein YyaL (SSP411 family)
MTNAKPQKNKIIKKNLNKKRVKTENPRHSPTTFFGSNSLAIEALIETLYLLGRLEKVDSARVEIARLLARSVDSNPENANLWRQYREAEEALRTVGSDDVEDFNQVIASIWSESALRDSPESES